MRLFIQSYLIFSKLFVFQTLLHLNNDLEKQVSALKRQLESETLLRVDLENKNKTLREELQFNQHVYETVRLKKQ
jgi:cell shape-determining protein MreC